MDASPRYPDPVDSLVGRILGETYEVERRLGVGGFGFVSLEQNKKDGKSATLASHPIAAALVRCQGRKDEDELGEKQRTTPGSILEAHYPRH